MHLIRFPEGSVTRLLETDQVTPATARALRERLQRETAVPGVEPVPRFFDAGEFATLRAVCDRLIPQADRPARVDLASVVDRRLADGDGNGWRYDVLPPDGRAYRGGLRGLDEAARQAAGRSFQQLDVVRQGQILAAVQRGGVAGGAWATVPPGRFFEELLAELCEVYYSHPLSQEEIGFVGMADVGGWPRVGLNERAAHEPPELGK